MPRSNPGGLTVALAGSSDTDKPLPSVSLSAGPLHSAPPSTNYNTEPVDSSSVSIPPSPASPKHQSRSFFSGYRTTRFGKQRGGPDYAPDRLPSNASSDTLNAPGQQFPARPSSPSPSQAASQSQGNLVETLSISDRSGLGSSAASEQETETDWTPETSQRADVDHFTQRRPTPSKHVFHQLMSRSRSTKADLTQQRQQQQRSTTHRRHLEPVLTEESYQEPPLTAPLEVDRNYRELMISSASRNKSADRTTVGSKEGSESNFKPGTSWESNMTLNPRAISTRTTGGLGKVGRGLINRFTKAPSNHEDSPQEPPSQPLDENYVFRSINLPLDVQTRRTRIIKRIEDAKDKTEFWMAALPYRCIDYLNIKGIEEEGLYRVPGSSTLIRKWQMRFDSAGDINLLDDKDLNDPNIIASLLKAWFRELPDDVFPRKAQSAIFEYCNGASQAPQELKDALSRLPPYNYYLLFAITCHLAMLHNNSEKTRMNYDNFRVCFLPCIRIDVPIFKLLVCDWRNCWQGCWTEKACYDGEYHASSDAPAPMHMPTLAPTTSSSAGWSTCTSSNADDQFFPSDMDFRNENGNRVASPTPALRGFSTLAIRDGARGTSPSVYEDYDSVPQSPSRPVVARSTPPTLSPVATLSPMRL